MDLGRTNEFRKKVILKNFPNESRTKKFELAENPNEQYLFTNFLFATGKHNLLVHVTEKLLLKVSSFIRVTRVPIR